MCHSNAFRRTACFLAAGAALISFFASLARIMHTLNLLECKNERNMMRP
jgi:hypothetical protein